MTAEPALLEAIALSLAVCRRRVKALCLYRDINFDQMSQSGRRVAKRMPSRAKSGRMRARFMETNMTLLKFSDVSLAFGAMPLLDKVSWQIARGERVCIIGRNGTGKSSMLRLVKGEQKGDDGEVWRAPGLKIGELPQELPVADERTVFDVVAAGLDASASCWRSSTT